MRVTAGEPSPHFVHGELAVKSSKSAAAKFASELPSAILFVSIDMIASELGLQRSVQGTMVTVV